MNLSIVAPSPDRPLGPLHSRYTGYRLPILHHLIKLRSAKKREGGGGAEWGEEERDQVMYIYALELKN